VLVEVLGDATEHGDDIYRGRDEGASVHSSRHPDDVVVNMSSLCGRAEQVLTSDDLRLY
jgi:hypothetical protein